MNRQAQAAAMIATTYGNNPLMASICWDSDKEGPGNSHEKEFTKKGLTSLSLTPAEDQQDLEETEELD